MSMVRVVSGIDRAVSQVAARSRARDQFLDRNWFLAALQWLCSPSEQATARTIISEGKGGAPVIAIPIVRARSRLRSVIGSYWPHRGFPVAEDAEVSDMAALLVDPAARSALGHQWRFGPVADDDAGLRLLRTSAKATGWALFERRLSTAFVLDIPKLQAEEGWPRGSTLRKNRFHEKHLGSHGAVQWRYLANRDWTSSLMDALALVERRSWLVQDANADFKFLDPAQRGFWATLVADPVHAARLRVALLEIGDRPVAFSFDMQMGTMRHAIANSYDLALAKHSPGKCLQYRNILHAREEGVTEVDWGAGDSGYKQVIGAEARHDLVDGLMVRWPGLSGLSKIPGTSWKRTG